MARNDLTSLATLAGIAYMMNRDSKKGEKGDKKAATSGVDAVKEAAKIDTKPTATGIDTGMSEKEPGWESGTAPSTASAAPRASGPSAGGGRGRMGGPSAAQAVSNAGLSSAAPAAAKASYETPYDRMNRKNAEDSQAKADTDAETRKLRSAHPAPGRGVIDTSNINPKTLLPYKKGGAVKKMASGGSTSKGSGVKGWGIARGARKAQTY